MEHWVRVTLRTFLLRIEPATSEVKGERSDHDNCGDDNGGSGDHGVQDDCGDDDRNGCDDDADDDDSGWGDDDNGGYLIGLILFPQVVYL